jgi:type I restriction enzyme S subunit
LLKLSLDKNKIIPKYFAFLFVSSSFQKVFLDNTRGSAMQNIASVQTLKQMLLPIPPLNEQRRIVAKLETLLAKVDTCKSDSTKSPLSSSVSVNPSWLLLVPVTSPLIGEKIILMWNPL